MDMEERENKGSAEKKVNDVFGEKKENAMSYDEAMKACLEKKKGENSAVIRCKSIVRALMTRNDASSSSSIQKPRLVLRSGCLTDV